jgi:hypothetical protein
VEDGLKKFLLVFCFALVLAGGVFADHPDDKTGVGLFLGGGWAGVGGGLFNPGFSLKVPHVPLFWGFNASFGAATGLSVSADYYLVDRDLVRDGSVDLDWFLGAGLFTHFYFGDDFTMALGVRLPLGLSWHINRVFELFADVAPGIGLKFDSKPFYGAFTAELGLRVWI